MHQKKRNHDNVVAVGEVNGATIQVLIPDGMKDRFQWRIIQDDGKTVTSGKVLYHSLEEAMEEGLKILLPGVTPVNYREPDEQDYKALNVLLFGFKKGDPINTFEHCLQAHAFLVTTLDVLKQAAEKIPGDYGGLTRVIAESKGIMSDEVRLMDQLRELAVQSQDVMVQLCERDLDTLGTFIGAHLDL